jgi:hypothetical protein
MLYRLSYSHRSLDDTVLQIMIIAIAAGLLA